jgi:hypothetical protein
MPEKLTNRLCTALTNQMAGSKINIIQSSLAIRLPSYRYYADTFSEYPGQKYGGKKQLSCPLYAI